MKIKQKTAFASQTTSEATQKPSRTPAAGAMVDQSPTEKQTRRVWRKVTLNEKLKLEAAVGFGLPVDFAGKVVGIESSNTDRIIKDLKARRANEITALEH